MNKVIVKKVTTKREMDDFVRLPARLYRGCPQYVPDLESDIRDAFNPRKNAGLQFCLVQPFVAYEAVDGKRRQAVVRIDIPQETPARYVRVARLAKEMFGLRLRTMTASDAKGDCARRAFQLLNECYSPLFGFTEFTLGQMENFMRKYLLLVDRQLMPIVENEAGELVGVAVTMVSLVEALQKSRGRLWPTGWWHLLRALKFRRSDHAEMLLVAVRPDYQGLGVNALFFEHLVPLYNEYGIRWAETGPQLEDNVRVLAQWKPLRPQMVKRRRCYFKRLEG